MADDEGKARLQAIMARIRANRGASAVAATAVAKFKARVEANREEARRLKVRYNIPLNELQGDAYADEAKLRSLKDDAFNWVTEAVVVVGQHQLCTTCGHQCSATSGFYLRQQHVTQKHSRRLKHIQAIPEGYEIETVTEGVVLSRCIECVSNEKRVEDLWAAALYEAPLSITNQLRLDLEVEE